MFNQVTSGRRSALIESGCWFIFALLAYTYTFQFDDIQIVYELGPAHWPRMILVGILIASGLSIYANFRARQTPVEGENSDTKSSTDKSTQIRIALIFTVPILYTYLIHKIGFLLITPLFLFAYLRLMGIVRLRTLILTTVGVYAMLVLVFVKLIFTYLPPGAGIFHTINGYILGFLT